MRFLEMKKRERSRLRRAPAPLPVRLDVDALLFAVAARPADVVRPVVRAYKLNQVAAGMVA